MSSTASAIAVPPPSAKERYRSFIQRHEIAWELFFAGLAVVFVGMAFIPVAPAPTDEATLELLEWIITGVFIVEFGSRLWAAPSRLFYVQGHIVDLISTIPPARWLRWFRLLRLLRLVRAFAGVGRAVTHFSPIHRFVRVFIAMAYRSQSIWQIKLSALLQPQDSPTISVRLR